MNDDRESVSLAALRTQAQRDGDETLADAISWMQAHAERLARLESPAAPQVAESKPALCLTDIMRMIREVRGFTSERRNEAVLATGIHSVNSGITWDHLVALCDAYATEQAINSRAAGHIDSLQQQLDSAREAERGAKERLQAERFASNELRAKCYVLSEHIRNCGVPEDIGARLKNLAVTHEAPTPAAPCANADLVSRLRAMADALDDVGEATDYPTDDQCVAIMREAASALAEHQG